MLRSISKAAVLVALLVVPAVANASLQQGDVIKFVDRNGSPGGEYGVRKKLPDNTYSDELFVTFCLEMQEFLNFNVDFKVGDISDRAVEGGESAGAGYDVLDGRTAWLYLQFHTGALAAEGYNGSTTEANRLQHAIWRLEDEAGYDSGLSEKYFDLANDADAGEIAYALTRVRVLNVTTMSGGYAQDVLYVIPEAVVPEPTTVVVWSALSCIGLLCYRRSRANKLA